MRVSSEFLTANESPRPPDHAPAANRPRTAAAAVDGILDTIGGTPLVRLRRLVEGAEFEVYAKLESLNPGGSIKDRPAREIVDDALRTGALRAGSTVIESSSGNMAIGLAQACRYHGLRFICVVDTRTAAQNLKVLRAYGAEIELVSEPDPVTGELLQARLHRVQTLLEEIDGSFWPNQYANRANPFSHYSTTMTEIVEALDGAVDYLFVGTSTCGTIRGCAEYVRDHGLATRVIAVDAVGSRIFADTPAPRRIPGLGAGIEPPLCDRSLIDGWLLVDDAECIAGCRRLLAREAILAGGSSGGVAAAVERARRRIPRGARCVLILPDRGERYLDTIFDDQWVERHFGRLDEEVARRRSELRPFEPWPAAARPERVPAEPAVAAAAGAGRPG